VAQLIVASKSAGEFDVAEYERLLKMQANEERAMSSLATRMRLSHQSRMHRESTVPPTPRTSKRPWDCSNEKRIVLSRANQRLALVRHLWRLAHELRMIPMQRYEHGSRLLIDLGRQVGGWLLNTAS
jgi:hypothetical protein